MDDALDVVDEKEWRDEKLLEAIFGCDRRWDEMMERFYNVMVESFGTEERRKPMGSVESFRKLFRL